MGALYDTDAWSLFPVQTPPAAEKLPAEEAEPEKNKFKTRFLFDPGAIIIILAWIIFWWILFK